MNCLLQNQRSFGYHTCVEYAIYHNIYSNKYYKHYITKDYDLSLGYGEVLIQHSVILCPRHCTNEHTDWQIIAHGYFNKNRHVKTYTEYENGKMIKRINFRKKIIDDKHNSECKSYNDKGELESHYIYEHGKLIEVVYDLDYEGKNYVLPKSSVSPLYVWKLCTDIYSGDTVYVCIEVPNDAKRITYSKDYISRINYGKVIKIENERGLHHDSDKNNYLVAMSDDDEDILYYKLNKIVKSEECNIDVYKYKEHCL